MSTLSVSGSGSQVSELIARRQKLFEQIEASNSTDASSGITDSSASSDVTTVPSADVSGSGTQSLSSLGGNLSSSMVAQLISMLQSINATDPTASTNSTDDSQSADASGSSTDSSPLDPSKLFAKLDTNGDGKLSEDEFVAGRPDGVSEAQAKALFEKLDSSGSGSITEAQLADGASVGGAVGHHHHHHAVPSTDDSDDSTDSASATDPTTGTTADINTLMTKLMQAIQSYSTSNAATDSSLTGTLTNAISA